MAVEEHLDYTPGRGHILEMQTIASGLVSFGIPKWKAEPMAVYLWKGMRKVHKKEAIYVQGQGNGR